MTTTAIRVERNGDRNQIEGDFVNFDERRAEVPHGLIGRLVDQLGGTRLDGPGVNTRSSYPLGE